MINIIGPTPSLQINQRHGVKKYPMQSPMAPGKPLPTYQVPRIPTDKQVAEVCRS